VIISIIHALRVLVSQYSRTCFANHRSLCNNGNNVLCSAYSCLVVPPSLIVDSVILRYLPATFRREVLRQCQTSLPLSAVQLIEEPLKEGITRDNLVDIASHTLPRIISNVILNKREEVIPLLLSIVKLQGSSAEREKLLQILFNLQKRPQEDDRQMIVVGKERLFFFFFFFFFFSRHLATI
jgi:hypothetical protein